MGDGTKHPEASGLNVGSKGILFGSQAANTNITGDSTSISIQGATQTNIGINGTSNMLELETGIIRCNSLLSIKGGIKVNGENVGQTTGSFKVDDVGTGYYLLNFMHGILIGFEDHHS